MTGEIEVRGSKNAALPILAATILTKEPCVISNLPLIEDVMRMIDIIGAMGAKIEWLGERKAMIRCDNINPEKIPGKIIGHLRGSALLWGALLSRFNNFKTTAPGGDIIGARSLDTHFDAFLQMGIDVKQKGRFNYFKKIQEVKENITVSLDEFSVTATENVLLFASSILQTVVLKIADQDYQVQELAKVLRKMGVKIKMGFHEFEITGTKKPKGFSHNLIADPIEAGTFIVAALATKGEVLVKNVEINYLTLFLKKMAAFGANFEFLGKRSVRVLPSPKLIITKIQSMPYPGIHTDLQSPCGVLATQTKGSTLIHDPLYEGRLKYLEELNKMGADIIFCDPHRAIVNGPTSLHGIEVPSLDLRSGASLIIAGLAAQGTTIINNAYQVDRGYEKIEERLQKLGADIRRISA